MDLVLTMFEAGRSLAEAASVLRVLIPLFGFLGSGTLFAWGAMGLLVGRTFSAFAPRGSNGRVHGGPAMVVGAIYLVTAIVMVVVLAPLSAGLVVGR